MSRIIKYRGKVEDQWDYATPEDNHWEQFWALVDRSTVGEWTGLTDRNGKEIYENDVDKNGWVVSWCNGQGALLGASVGWYIQRTQYGHDWYYSATLACSGNLWQTHKSDCVDIEIAGNIHDNPELITVEPWTTPQAYWDSETGYTGKDGSIYSHMGEVQP